MDIESFDCSHDFASDVEEENVYADVDEVGQ